VLAAARQRRLTWPRVQVRLPADYLADFERIYVRLASDAREYGVDALAVHDWPRGGPEFVIQLVTVGEQLESLYRKVCRWATEGGTQDLAHPLMAAILRLLRPAGFVAPTTPPPTITPPQWIRVAIARLQPVTPHAAALATPQPGDTPEITTDRWRIGLWAAEIS
jgi:hypothetical protein